VRHPFTAEQNLSAAVLLTLTKDVMTGMIADVDNGFSYRMNRRKRRRRLFNRRIREVREMYAVLVELDDLT